MSDGAMNNASRIAPVSGSRSAWTIVLNCLPRRVLRTKLPSGTSGSDGSTTRKRALPSGIGNVPPSHRRVPPHCTASPVVCSSSTPE